MITADGCAFGLPTSSGSQCGRRVGAGAAGETRAAKPYCSAHFNVSLCALPYAPADGTGGPAIGRRDGERTERGVKMSRALRPRGVRLPGRGGRTSPAAEVGEHRLESGGVAAAEQLVDR